MDCCEVLLHFLRNAQVNGNFLAQLRENLNFEIHYLIGNLKEGQPSWVLLE